MEPEDDIRQMLFYCEQNGIKAVVDPEQLQRLLKRLAKAEEAANHWAEQAAVYKEREQALAAHVERWRKGVYLVEGWAIAEAEGNHGDAREWLRHLRNWIEENASDEAPETSLAAHDAELLNKPFEGLPGCTDGGCVVRKPTGMHTNGGCQCIRYQTASTIVQRLAALRDQRRRQARGG